MSGFMRWLDISRTKEEEEENGLEEGGDSKKTKGSDTEKNDWRTEEHKRDGGKERRWRK